MSFEAAFREVVDIAQQQAKASTALEEIARSQTAKLESVNGVLAAQTAALNSLAQSITAMTASQKESRDAMKEAVASIVQQQAEGRTVAVNEVKTHFDLHHARSDRRINILIWLATGLIAASNVLGPTVAALVSRATGVNTGP